MYATSFLFRLVKSILVGAIGVMAAIIVVGNTTDYYTNYVFVAHVMKMDSIFPQSHIHYRSITSPVFFHAGYIFIIAMETLMAVCCLKGSWLLFKNIRSDSVKFHAAKNWGVGGILVGIVIWFLGFEVVGGEWFAMWQSPTWNGLTSAERIVSFLSLVLILLHLRDE
jgi:predicted small integral membrane protein